MKGNELKTKRTNKKYQQSFSRIEYEYQLNVIGIVPHSPDPKRL